MTNEVERVVMYAAALFVETDGSYFGLPGVDAWDEKRDARLYNNVLPVVAHPPMGFLGNRRNEMNKKAVKKYAKSPVLTNDWRKGKL